MCVCVYMCVMVVMQAAIHEYESQQAKSRTDLLKERQIEVCVCVCVYVRWRDSL